MSVRLSITTCVRSLQNLRITQGTFCVVALVPQSGACRGLWKPWALPVPRAKIFLAPQINSLAPFLFSHFYWGIMEFTCGGAKKIFAPFVR